MARTSPFHERTAALCTSYRWKEWAGYHAVSSYDTSVEREYFAYRHAAGLFDASPLIQYDVRGPDATAYLSRLSVRSVEKLAVGRVVYCCWTDDRGYVIDDGTIARLDDPWYRVTTGEPELWWLEQNRRGYEVAIEETTHRYAVLALQGPCSREILVKCCGSDIAGLRYFGLTHARLAGRDVVVSRTGYTGDLGYEIWAEADSALPLWDALMEEGRDYGILPAGLDALDVTRLEAGYLMLGVDYRSAPRCQIDAQKSTPYEIGLGWMVQLDREPFIGRAALKAEKERGSEWALVGLEVSWPSLEALYARYGLPPSLPTHAWRTAVPLYDGKRQIGQATSGTWSPTLKRNIALGTVRSGYERIGTRLEIEVTVEFTRHTIPATVVERPFFDPERRRS